MTLQKVDRAAGPGDRAADLADRILPIMREILAKPELTATDEAMEHGGTSLLIVRILAETSRRLDLLIDPRDLDGIFTARSLAQAAR